MNVPLNITFAEYRNLDKLCFIFYLVQDISQSFIFFDPNII